MSVLDGTTLVDDFNDQPDGENLQDNGNKLWTDVDAFLSSFNGLAYYFNACEAAGDTGQISSSTWNGTYGPDQRVVGTYAIDAGQSDSAVKLALFLRWSSGTGYLLNYFTEGGQDWITVQAMFDSVTGSGVIDFTALASPVALGDVFALEVIGTAVKVFINDVVVARGTDSTYSGAANDTTFGIGVQGIVVGIDDVYFGDGVTTAESGGTEYNDAPVGTNHLSGTRVEGISHSSTRTGTQSPHGSIVESWNKAVTYNDSPSGTNPVSGSVVQSMVFGDTRTGAALSSGSVQDAVRYDDVIAGEGTPSGTCSESWSQGTTYDDSPSGSATPSGSIAESLAHGSVSSGRGVASGSVVELLVRESRPTGLLLVVGSLAESASYNDSPVGHASPTGTLRQWSSTIPRDRMPTYLLTEGYDVLVESTPYGSDAVIDQRSTLAWSDDHVTLEFAIPYGSGASIEARTTTVEPGSITSQSSVRERVTYMTITPRTTLTTISEEP